MAAHQAPQSLGFSRQEHWSGLPFHSPIHETEKWKWSLSVVSDSLRPPGLQPTRFLHPWDFQGKSTGMGCHCLLPHELYRPWNSPVQNTGVGSLCFLQGIFPTQGSNPGLPPCRQILYQLSHKNTGVGSLSLLHQIFPTQESNLVSCIAGGFFTSWATREAHQV